MRNVLKHSRPTRGFASTPSITSPRVIQKQLNRCLKRTPSNASAFIADVLANLPDFPNNPKGYLELQRLTTAADFSSRIARKDYRYLPTDDLLGGVDAPLVVTNDGPYAFTASQGLWRLKTSPHSTALVDERGKVRDTAIYHPAPDIELDVFLGGQPIVHPTLVSAYWQGLMTERGVSVETYQQWKQAVNQQVQSVIPALIAAYCTAFPGLNAWSYMLSPASERLIQRIPQLTIKHGLCFLLQEEGK